MDGVYGVETLVAPQEEVLDMLGGHALRARARQGEHPGGLSEAPHI